MFTLTANFIRVADPDWILPFWKGGLIFIDQIELIIFHILLLSIIFHSNHVELFKYSILIFHFSINTQAHSSLPLTLFGRLVYQVHNKLNIYINSDTLKYCMSKKYCPILQSESLQEKWTRLIGHTMFMLTAFLKSKDNLTKHVLYQIIWGGGILSHVSLKYRCKILFWNICTILYNQEVITYFI